MWKRSRFLLLLEHGLLRLSLPARPLAPSYGALHAEPRRPAAEVSIIELLSTPQQQKRCSILMDIIYEILCCSYLFLSTKRTKLLTRYSVLRLLPCLSHKLVQHTVLQPTLYNLMRSHLHFNKYILILFNTISFLCT